MSRPRSSNGEYGRMPSTCSTVVSIVNNGTISTMPPTAMVTSVPSNKKIAFFSNHSWRMNIASGSCHAKVGREGPGRRISGSRHLRGRAGDSQDQVVDHDQTADQK